MLGMAGHRHPPFEWDVTIGGLQRPELRGQADRRGGLTEAMPVAMASVGGAVDGARLMSLQA
jgi:hypothetical protein